MAEEFVAMVQTDGVGALKPAHALDEVGFGGFDDEVEVIAHEAVCMYLPRGFLTGLRECFQEIVTVGVIEKDVLSTIAAAHDVVNRTGILNAYLAGHGGDGERWRWSRKVEKAILRTDPFVWVS